MTYRVVLLLILLCWHISPCAAAEDALQAVLDRLGISLPDQVSNRLPIASRLDQLRREPCDQTAIFDLGKGLEDAGYRREAATALVSFSEQCGGNEGALRRAANILLKLTDYRKTIDITNKIVELAPYNDNGYYLRARAYDGIKDYKQAIADYVTGIELFGDKDRISSNSYIRLSDAYAALEQYCEAMRPIEAWVAINPARNDTSQTRAILATLAQKGNCSSETSGRGETIAVSGAGKQINVAVQVNGTRGRFLLDTGATFVLVRRTFASSARLHVQDDGRIRLHTANGVGSAVLGRADTVKLGTIEARNVAVAVQSDSDAAYGQGVDGLLGMSFLSRFDVRIDERAVMIRPRTPAR
jgi:clan AA aspartic protease (TIGR02281 family)